MNAVDMPLLCHATRFGKQCKRKHEHGGFHLSNNHIEIDEAEDHIEWFRPVVPTKVGWGNMDEVNNPVGMPLLCTFRVPGSNGIEWSCRIRSGHGGWHVVRSIFSDRTQVAVSRGTWVAKFDPGEHFYEGNNMIVDITIKNPYRVGTIVERMEKVGTFELVMQSRFKNPDIRNVITMRRAQM